MRNSWMKSMLQYIIAKVYVKIFIDLYAFTILKLGEKTLQRKKQIDNKSCHDLNINKVTARYKVKLQSFCFPYEAAEAN